jgi:hypothetical protein
MSRANLKGLSCIKEPYLHPYILMKGWSHHCSALCAASNCSSLGMAWARLEGFQRFTLFGCV